MDKTFHIPIIPDKQGFIGRECSKCGRYFKVRVGTGLKTTKCHCPYCNHLANNSDFGTHDQIEYAKSVGLRQIHKEVIEPMMKDFQRSIEKLNRFSSGPIQLRVTSSYRPGTLPSVHRYREKELETYVRCDSCGLEFAIYGVFGNCPDCGRLNAQIIFTKSIEIAQKLISLGTLQQDPDLREEMFKSALVSGVSAFDSLGKALQLCHPDLLPAKPRNLFQNLDALSDALEKSVGQTLDSILGQSAFQLLYKYFQLRHIHEHNKGVVDADCIRKLPEFRRLVGRKHRLEDMELNEFLHALLHAGIKVITALSDATG